MKVVVGLGNPGRRYERTRHNVGFEVVEELARRGSAPFRKSWRNHAHWCSVDIDGQALLLVKPQTFMNRSGTSVRLILKRKGLAAADLIVVVDDVDLEPGALRIRGKGGAGGHKGLRSIVDDLGTEEFIRLRVGIGGRMPGRELVGHVLSDFSAEERAVMDSVIPRAADAVVSVARDGLEKAMNDFN